LRYISVKQTWLCGNRISDLIIYSLYSLLYQTFFITFICKSSNLGLCLTLSKPLWKKWYRLVLYFLKCVNYYPIEHNKKYKIENLCHLLEYETSNILKKKNGIQTIQIRNLIRIILLSISINYVLCKSLLMLYHDNHSNLFLMCLIC